MAALEVASRGAIFDDARVYRYVLTRTLKRDATGRTVSFVCLNPSKADEHIDDNTVRRCLRFAHEWGYTHVNVLNIFALRSTDPRALYASADPVGPLNDYWINSRVGCSDLIVAAWGNHGKHLERSKKVRGILSRHMVYCFGITKEGEPKHPLYLPLDAELMPLPQVPSVRG